MAFEWKSGAKLSGDAQQVGLELQAIEKQMGNITPNIVVERARDKLSALHDYFTWNDKEAAAEHRLEQARLLIRSVVVRIENGNQPIITRAFVTCQTNEQGPYMGIAKVMASEELWQIMLQNALRDVRAFQQKYAMLSSVLRGLFGEAEKLERKYRSKGE